jgi:hypothetical protein
MLNSLPPSGLVYNPNKTQTPNECRRKVSGRIRRGKEELGRMFFKVDRCLVTDNEMVLNDKICMKVVLS